jgi:hypothetical protein
VALENIYNSDMLYHNADHTMQVTLVGQEILIGKHLSEGGVTPKDWVHYILATLFHDIGYVKGVCRGDANGKFATGIGDETVALPVGGTDACLTPYHVDRSKRFVMERFGHNLSVDIDPETVTSYIEMTKFPPPDDERYKETCSYAALVRSADFIGQLGDPNYLRKLPGLFAEFEETGANEQIGYSNPGDMRANYAKFFWDVVRPYIQNGISYLNITLKGKQWISSLYSHVFMVEHDGDLE